ncbi:hypothetical protein DPMN_149101 [Dreissena polymorpha]|uniref:Uncharacterized protein n=1 Tax=Dreissena polymorpha TaxID=45954 RepID=A0A9D4J503_DREPO|nr:hypothetical protein DPMN_149101 [Dreissena polymorpha]
MAASIVGRALGVQTMPLSNRLGSNWVTQTPALSPCKYQNMRCVNQKSWPLKTLFSKPKRRF